MPFCSLDSFLPLMNGTQVMVHVMAAKSAPEISEAVWLPSNACDHKEWRLTAASKEKPSFLLDPFSWQNDWLYLWPPNLSKLKVIHQTQSRQNEILPPFYSDIESFLEIYCTHYFWNIRVQVQIFNIHRAVFICCFVFYYFSEPA